MNSEARFNAAIFGLALLGLSGPAIFSAESKKLDSRLGVESTIPNAAATQVLMDLHRINAMEIEMGKMAQSKSPTAEVRQYGATLVTDHESAQKRVTALASDRNVSVGQKNETPSGESATTYKNDSMSHLNTLKGKAFDRAFLKQMVADHTQAAQMLRRAESMLADANDVKMLVKEVIPVVERHLSLANDLLRQVEKTNRPS